VHPRRVIAASTIALLPLILISCSSDDTKSSAKAPSTTNSKAGSKETVPGSQGVTSTTAAPKPFKEGVQDVTTGIDSAGGDVCKLASELTQVGNIGNPSTAAEAKQAMGLLTKLFGAIADAAPADLSKEAATIKATMEKADQQAAAAGYDPKVFTSSDGLSALQDPGFTQAMGTFSQAVTSKCGVDPLGGASGTESTPTTTKP